VNLKYFSTVFVGLSTLFAATVVSANSAQAGEYGYSQGTYSQQSQQPVVIIFSTGGYPNQNQQPVYRQPEYDHTTVSNCNRRTVRQQVYTEYRHHRRRHHDVRYRYQPSSHPYYAN
jgi:hypothetical protein